MRTHHGGGAGSAPDEMLANQARAIAIVNQKMTLR
jgi:hypothetical protein